MLILIVAQENVRIRIYIARLLARPTHLKSPLLYPSPLSYTP